MSTTVALPSLWKDEETAGLSERELLIYRSNRLGDDPRVVNTNGGNTSAKLREVDPVTGEKVTVLWVKGSGCDLRTCAPQNFASLYQDRILALEKIRPTLECEDKGAAPMAAVTKPGDYECVRLN